MIDRYVAVKMPYGYWAAYIDNMPGLQRKPDMKFGSEEEMKLSMAAKGYELVSGDGVRFAQVWRRDSPGNSLEKDRRQC